MEVCVLLREESVEVSRDEVCLSCVAGVVLMCVFFSYVCSFRCTMGLIDKLPNGVGYGCV